MSAAGSLATPLESDGAAPAATEAAVTRLSQGAADRTDGASEEASPVWGPRAKDSCAPVFSALGPSAGRGRVQGHLSPVWGRTWHTWAPPSPPPRALLLPSQSQVPRSAAAGRHRAARPGRRSTPPPHPPSRLPDLPVHRSVWSGRWRRAPPCHVPGDAAPSSLLFTALPQQEHALGVTGAGWSWDCHLGLSPAPGHWAGCSRTTTRGRGDRHGVALVTLRAGVGHMATPKTIAALASVLCVSGAGPKRHACPSGRPLPWPSRPRVTSWPPGSESEENLPSIAGSRKSPPSPPAAGAGRPGIWFCLAGE